MGDSHQNMMRHENIDLFKSPREEEATIDQMDDHPTGKPTMNRILTVFLSF